MRSAQDVMNSVPKTVDPIDQYLTVLSQTKSMLEKDMPRIQQGVNSILGSNSLLQAPNGIPQNLGPNAYNAFGKGYASSIPSSTSPKDGTVGAINQLVSNSYQPGAIPKVTGPDTVRTWGFSSGAGRTHNFDRYYYHPKFKELGWSPYMDNEAYYNKNSTWLDDFARATTQWSSLAGIGFTQTATNWDDLFSFNTEGDTKSARQMEEAMAIANSSRGGVGGFVTNMYANSAYTYGVVSEIIAEEVVLWGATALTEGALAPVAAGRTGVNAIRLGKLGKWLFNTADKLGDASDLARGGLNVADAGHTMTTAANSVNDIDKARKFWTGVGNFINPFEDTFETVKNIRQGADGFDKLTDMAKLSKTFGAFYRDMRGMNAALAESRLEGGFVQNSTFDKLVQDYINKNGVAPDGDDLKDIEAQAKKAGVTTTLLNFPAIQFSNKIVFEKALGGFKPFRELTKGGLGEMVINYGKRAKNRFEGFVDPSKASEWFTKRNLKRIGNQFRPQNIAKNGLRYTAANLAEGLQETYQESISEAMTNYYIDTYLDPARAGSATFAAALEQGFGSQMNAKGLETFLSGFLMGGLVQGPQTLVTQTLPGVARDMYQKKTDPKAYEERKKQYEQDRANITNYLNKVAADPNLTLDAIYANLKAQKDFATIMDKAEEDGDKKTHGDALQDSIFSNVKLLLDRGYIDLFTDQLDSYKKMTDQELFEAFNTGKDSQDKNEFNKSLRERLDSVSNKIDEIKKRYEKYSSIKNVFNKDSEDILEKLDWFGFEQARTQAIYNEYTFDRSQSRMGSILQAVASDPVLAKIKAGNITNIFNESQLDDELSNLKDEIKIYSEGNVEQKKIAAKKQKIFDALTKVKNSIVNQSMELNRSKKATVNPEVAKEIKDDLDILERLVEGTMVAYQPKSGPAISGKIIKRTPTKVTIEYTDSKGEKKTKVVSPKAKSLKILGGGKQLELEFDSDTTTGKHLDYFRQQLRKDLEEYLKVLADESEDGSGPILATDVDRIFTSLEDYLELGVDARAASMMVNILNDPLYFSQAARQFSDAAKAAHSIAAAKLKEAFVDFEKRMQANKLLQELYSTYNVFILPEEIDALLKGERIPSKFIEVIGETMKEVDVRSKKYKDILGFIEKYEEDNGFTIAGKPIIEEGVEAGQRMYMLKDPKDKRSLKDMMLALGLDPTLDSQEVDLKTVLEFVVASKYANPGLKQLARRLLGTIKPEDKIEINTKRPIAFSYSKQDGIIVDPRYAAFDYGQEQISLEYALLNPVIQKIVDEGMSDSKFKESVTNLMSAVEAFFEANKESMSDDQKNVFSWILSSPSAFLSESITSSPVQAILETIPYEVKNKSVWQDLLDAIKDLLAKIFGIKSTAKNTALEEAVGIISNKAEGKPIIGKADERVETNPQGGTAITINTPFNDMPKDLQQMLRYELGMFNEELIQQNKPIVQANQISEFIKTNPRAKQVIEMYNKRNGLTGSPENQPTSVKEITVYEGYELVEYEDGFFDLRKDGQTIASFLNDREEAIAVADNHKKGKKSKRKISNQFRGKLIYFTPGSSLENLDALEGEIVNGEELLMQALVDNGIDVEKIQKNPKLLSEVMYSLLKDNPQLASKVYEDALNLMQNAASLGATVITSVQRFAEKSDIVIINTNDKAIEVALGSKGAVSGIRAYETRAKKNRITNNIKIYETTDSIASILTGEKKPKSPKDKFKGKIRESIEAAKTMEEIDDIYLSTVNAELDEENLDIEEFKQLINNKRKELMQKSATFEEVRANDIVVMKKENKIVQILGRNLTDGTIRIRPLDSEQTIVMAKKDFDDEVGYMYRPGTDSVRVKPTVTPTEKALSNENLEKAIDINSTEAILRDSEKAKNSSQKDIDEEFTNSLGCE
jgi:hypothetical protein